MLREGLRQGRFKHRLLEPAFLNQHSESLFHSVEKLREYKTKNEISDSEFAALYLTLFMAARRPQDFLGGPHNINLSSYQNIPAKKLSVATAIEILKAVAPALSWQKLNRLPQDQHFVAALCSFSWRSIPFAASRALQSWDAGQYPLQLLTHLPSPEEVLDFQCKGFRCVSVLCRQNEISSYVEEGRDVLGFVVHDLIHADHFFHDQEAAAAQIIFSQRLQIIHRTESLQSMLKQDLLFKGEWNYLISDMNSVPLHLLMTLKAVVLGYIKRQNQIAVSDALPIQFEVQFTEVFQSALQLWNLNHEEMAAALRLNTPSYRHQIDGPILVKALAPQPS